MKKLSFLLVAFALVTFVSLNACKSSTEKTPEVTAPQEEVIEESIEEVVEDTAAAATTDEMEEETVAEEATE
jgi:hypothetical protein